MRDQRFETIAIHAGQDPDPATGAVITPIYATSTYAQDAPGDTEYEYSRTDNPTRTALQTALAHLEGVGERAEPSRRLPAWRRWPSSGTYSSRAIT